MSSRKKFIKDTQSVFWGSLISQLIPIVLTLLLTRQYNPSDFGSYSVWLSITIFISVILTLRLETSLPMQKTDVRKKKAVLYIFTTVILLAILLISFLLLLSIFRVKVPAKFDLYLLLQATLGALFLSLIQTWQSWLSALGDYKELSLVRIIQGASISFIQVSLGMLKPSTESLIFSHILGLFLSFILCFSIKPINYFSFNIKKLIKSTLKFWISHYRFLFYSLPSDLISTGTAQLPLLIILNRFGADYAGLLALALRVVGAPVSLVSSSLLDVFKKYAADAFKKKGDCREEYINAFKLLSLFSVMFYVTFTIFGEYLFDMLFGKKWGVSASIAIILLPMISMKFIASPLSFLTYIVQKQHIDFFWQIGLMIGVFFALTVPITFNLALTTYSFFYAAFYLIYIIMSYRFSIGEK